MPKDNGGQAFPNVHFPNHAEGYDGMTLRDYFAGQAIIGLLIAGRNILFDFSYPFLYFT